MTDNYKAVVEYDIKRFLAGDPQEMAALAGLKIENNRIIVPLFNEKFTLDILNGAIRSLTKPEQEPTSYQKMFILHHLLETKPQAQLSGEYVTIRSIKDAWVHEKAFENAGTKPLARAFSGRLADFIKVARQLGGQTAAGGDYSFILHALPLIPLQIIFWDGEEDIPAAANILFDKNITDFTHPEDVIGLGEAAADLIIAYGENLT